MPFAVNLQTEREEEAPSIPKVHRDDAKFASAKIAFVQYLTVAVFLFLLAGFWDLQIRNPEVYHQRAEKNRIKSTPVLAARGKILDRDGRIIVDNHSSYSAIISRENLREEEHCGLSPPASTSITKLCSIASAVSARPSTCPSSSRKS